MTSSIDFNAIGKIKGVPKIDPNTTVAILIGVEQYEDANLPELHSAPKNVMALKDIFRGKVGIKETISITEEAKTTAAVLTKVQSEINRVQSDIQAKDPNKELTLIIFYYAGHGLLNSDYSKYYLSLSETKNDSDNKDVMLKTSAIEVSLLFGTFKLTNAAVILILDSCFSRKAFDDISFDNDFCIITATQGFEPAEYPEDKDYSVFTETLIDILSNGINNGKKELQLKDILDELKLKLVNQKKAEPKWLNSDNISDLAIINNSSKETNQVAAPFDLKRELNKIYRSLFGGSYTMPEKEEDIRSAVLKNYPTTISVYLMNLISDKTKLDDKYFLLGFYSAIIHFISFLLIKDLTDNGKVSIKDKDWLNSWKNLDPKEVTIDKFHLNVIVKCCDEYGSSLLIEELYNNKTQILSKINAIEQVFDKDRNLTSFAQFRVRLFNLLNELTFFKNYEMLAVRFIDVKKSYYKKIVFKHEVSSLYGEIPSSYSFSYKDFSLTSENDFFNNSIIFIPRISRPDLIHVNRIINDKKFINLWPFIVDGCSNLRNSTIPDLCVFVDVRISEDEKLFNYKRLQYIKEREEPVEYSSLCAFPGEDEWSIFLTDKS